jgi:hypothetical protein
LRATTPTSTDTVARSVASAALEWFGRPWRARVTTTYAAIITSTTLVLVGTPTRIGDAVLRSNSTNLRGLARDPVRVLVTSALFLEHGGYLFFLVTAVFVLAPLERWLGAWRALVTFAVGHVGASLLVAAGLTIGVNSGQVAASVARVMDVGPSYGTAASAALLCFRLPRRWRIVAVAALWTALLVGLVTAPSPTAWGHVAATVLGVACYPLVHWHRTRLGSPLDDVD